MIPTLSGYGWAALPLPWQGKQGKTEGTHRQDFSGLISRLKVQASTAFNRHWLQTLACQQTTNAERNLSAAGH